MKQAEQILIAIIVIVMNAHYAMNKAIKALEQQHCEDTISRQAAIDALTALEESAPTARHLSAIFDCEDAIKALPSA